MITVGDRLKYARKRLNLTQLQVANAIGVSKAAISSLEIDKSKAPKPDNLFKIAKFLNCNPYWITTGKGDMDGDTVPDEHIKNLESEKLLALIKQLPDEKRRQMIEVAENILKAEDSFKHLQAD